MKNNTIIIILLVIIIVILAYLAFLKTENHSLQIPVGEVQTKVSKIENNPIVEKKVEDHDYTNNQFGFFVDLPGSIVKDKSSTMSSGAYAASAFGISVDGSQKLSVVIPNNQVAWLDLIANTRSYVGTVTSNGVVFKHYTFGVDGGVGHYYVVEHNGRLYDISTNNPNSLSYFGFIN